ncbi:MAG: hypothetical protein F6K25_08410 [Okeania sp. SIO2G4]|nr:hypothetical protein [Okeania sp. SIO2G5]NEP71890.1 hypothetical protein [Okeania sp. SIO2G5]NEP93066.1 hypothetical protein [Okeania sp. SIO2F5]NEQ90734.1 hypothetical protein [Okeania sp. SIO2G4]
MFQKVQGFCGRYSSKKKSPRKCHWGSRLLGDTVLNFGEKRRSLTKIFVLLVGQIDQTQHC